MAPCAAASRLSGGKDVTAETGLLGLRALWTGHAPGTRPVRHHQVLHLQLYIIVVYSYRLLDVTAQRSAHAALRPATACI